MSDPRSLLSVTVREPGLYQIAVPGELEVTDREIVLREGEHFWQDKARGNTPAKLHTNQAGLRYQAGAVGIHVSSRLLQSDRRYCLAEATGSVLWSDGTLEVYRRSKEYDLDAELFHAGLKKVGNYDGQVKPTEKMGTGLAVVPTQETAIALVSQLPLLVQAEIMKDQMEVQKNRQALCCSKAENQVVRYFLAKAGGVLTAMPGCKEVKVKLQRAMIREKHTLQQLTDSLYGPAWPASPAPSHAAEPPDEDQDILEGELADSSDADEIAASKAENGKPPQRGPSPKARDLMEEIEQRLTSNLCSSAAPKSVDLMEQIEVLWDARNLHGAARLNSMRSFSDRRLGSRKVDTLGDFSEEELEKYRDEQLVKADHEDQDGFKPAVDPALVEELYGPEPEDQEYANAIEAYRLSLKLPEISFRNIIRNATKTNVSAVSELTLEQKKVVLAKLESLNQ